MARYDYRCMSCGKVFEVEHGMTEHPELSCPECGQPAEKVFSASGIEFKGKGFYNTDARDLSEHTERASTSAEHSCENCPHKTDA